MADQLQETFEELRERIGTSDRLSPMRSDPFFNFIHTPGETMEVHRRLPRWTAALQQDGWRVETHSLAVLMWQVVDRSRRWQGWLRYERAGTYDEQNAAMKAVLIGEQEAGPYVQALSPLFDDEDPRRVLLLTDAGLLHPWLRVRALESHFHDRIHGPTVVFYPGRRAGSSLMYLGFYTEDGDYRSTLLGGL